MTSPLLTALNPAQQKAIQAVGGPVLVLAGPGSGKTRLLTHRVAYLIEELGVDPFHILAVTFTNKAAREMKTRLDELLGAGRAPALTVGTFHGICARFLRRDISHLGRERDFAIYDSDDQERLMRRVLHELNIDEKKFAPRGILARISSAKNELVSVQEFARLNRSYHDEIVSRCYERYQVRLRENNALDFDDLLVLTVRLFEQHPAVLAHYHNRYTHILVDEYQDTNRAQYMIVRHLAAKHRNLFVVGDEDQCVPGDALVTTPEGSKPIEEVRPGDTVISAAGKGTITAGVVERVRTRSYKGMLVQATLRSGRVLRLTPNHMCFARLGASDEGTVRGRVDRVLVHLSMFGGSRPSLQSPWFMHRVWLNTTDQRLEQQVQRSGIATRDGRKSTWRVERHFTRMGEAEALAQQLAAAAGDTEIARWAMLTEGEKFAFQPASHLRPSMLVPRCDAETVGADEILTVEQVAYDGLVYDLDIAKVHNYIVDGVVVHNSIYAWRGADVRNILQFEDDYPDAQVFLLEQNYRSTQTILDLAQAVIQGGARHKHIKKLWTDNGAGMQVMLVEGYDQNDEARWVADEIARLVASGSYTLGDCAVMYRTNAQSRAVEEALIARGLRYQVVGGIRFYDRKEIKDVLAYLRLMLNPFDSVSLERIINVPARSIGQRTVAELQRWAADLGVPMYQALQELSDEETTSPFTARTRKALLGFLELMAGLMAARRTMNLPDLLTTILDRLNFRDALIREYGSDEGEERWANVHELYAVAQEYSGIAQETQLATFLEEVALVSDLDTMDRQTNVVTCITLHQAKGLEYRAVFLVGLEEGILPHSRSMNDRASLEEERRLLYVGATRARERLYLLYAFRRTTYGRTDVSTPSRFLADIPREMLKQPGKRPQATTARSSSLTERSSTGKPGATSRSQTPTLRQSQPSRPTRQTFLPGQRVRHGTFGEGVVLSSKLIEGDEEVTVHFATKGEKRLLASFARLQRLTDDG